MIQRDFPNSGATLSGLGGVNTGRDAAEFILLGSNTVQARGGGGIGCTSMAETGTTTQLGSCTASACRCQLTGFYLPLLAAKQVCTGVMLHGYPLVKTLCGGLQVGGGGRCSRVTASLQHPPTCRAAE